MTNIKRKYYTYEKRERGRKKDIQINNLPQVPVVPGSHYRRHTCVSAVLWQQSCGQSSQYPPERRTPVLNRTRWTSASLEYPWLSTLLWVESPLPACGVEPLRTLWTDGWFIILCGNVINDFVIITCSTWMTLNKKNLASVKWSSTLAKHSTNEWILCVLFIQTCMDKKKKKTQSKLLYSKKSIFLTKL